MKNLVVITFLHFVSLFSFFLQLDNLSQQELASRLTLNCMNCYVEPQKLRDLDITVMDVRNLDQSRADPMFVDVGVQTRPDLLLTGVSEMWLFPFSILYIWREKH